MQETTISEFKNLGYDVVFKSIFYKHEDLLKWLMNRTFISLKSDYYLDNFNIINGELTNDSIHLRNRRMDALVEDDDIVYNIEVNRLFDEETVIRNYLFQCNYLIFMVKKGMRYKTSVKPVVQINYNLNTVKKLSLDGKIKDVNIDTKEEYFFLKEIINIDIAKYMDKWYNLGKSKEYYELYKHFLIFGMTKEDWIELEDRDVMINKIKNQIFKLNDPSEFPRLFTDEEFLQIEKNSSYDNGLEKGLEQGLAEGLEQGTIKTNINNARKMKQCNISDDVISNITGLEQSFIATL